MSEEQQFERLYAELTDLRKVQTSQGNTLVEIKTLLREHIKGSGPIRDKVERHEQSIQRMRGVGWLLALAWTSFLTYLGFHNGGK